MSNGRVAPTANKGAIHATVIMEKNDAVASVVSSAVSIVFVGSGAGADRRGLFEGRYSIRRSLTDKSDSWTHHNRRISAARLLPASSQTPHPQNQGQIALAIHAFPPFHHLRVPLRHLLPSRACEQIRTKFGRSLVLGDLVTSFEFAVVQRIRTTVVHVECDLKDTQRESSGSISIPVKCVVISHTGIPDMARVSHPAERNLRAVSLQPDLMRSPLR